MIRRPPGSALFRYTTLFRSAVVRRLPRVLGYFAGLRESSFREKLRVAAMIPSAGDLLAFTRRHGIRDRKSTRLNSSHANISYAVFCLKNKIIYLSAPFCPYP